MGRHRPVLPATAPWPAPCQLATVRVSARIVYSHAHPCSAACALYALDVHALNGWGKPGISSLSPPRLIAKAPQCMCCTGSVTSKAQSSSEAISQSATAAAQAASAAISNVEVRLKHASLRRAAMTCVLGVSQTGLMQLLQCCSVRTHANGLPRSPDRQCCRVL